MARVLFMAQKTAGGRGVEYGLRNGIGTKASSARGVAFRGHNALLIVVVFVLCLPAFDLIGCDAVKVLI